MILKYTEHFQVNYWKAPAPIRRAFDKQIKLFAANIRHPSLRAKKYEETLGVWQARVNKDWRFYFIIKGNICTVIDIIPHPK